MIDFVTWFGDGDDDFSENAVLKTALSALGVTVDLRALYVSYFERTSVGTGDVYAYQPTEKSKSIFAVDLYRGLTDQMDIVSFAVGCDEHCLPVVRDKLRSFFDGASCQVHYEEANYLPRFRRMIDAKTYPLIIEESGYKQQLHRAYG